MPLFTRGDQNILFVHIPKTGGTTVEDYFRDLSMFDQDARHLYTPWNVFVKNSLQNKCRVSLQHLTVKEMQSIFPEEFIHSLTHVFTITRNPYDRLISEYWYLKKKVFRTSKDYKIWGVDPNKIQNALQDMDSFVDFMYREYSKDPTFLDNHFRPQVDFIQDLPSHLAPLLMVFEFDDLKNETMIPDLIEAYSLDKDKHQMELATAVHKNHHTPSDQKMIWLRVTEDKIRQWYKDDFKTFGYAYRPYLGEENMV